MPLLFVCAKSTPNIVKNALKKRKINTTFLIRKPIKSFSSKNLCCFPEKIDYKGKDLKAKLFHILKFCDLSNEIMQKFHS